MEECCCIAGITVNPLRQIYDERGGILHMLRVDSEAFATFGEIYFSEINPGHIKAWKRHLRMSQNIAVPSGRVLFVMYDPRTESSSQGKIMEITLGRSENYRLLHIPPMIWYGFMSLDDRPSIIANCPDLPHDPSEVERLPENSPSIPYTWKTLPAHIVHTD